MDNASTDGTAAVAAAGGARVVAEPFRQIARARNRGAREGRGRYLFFVDADTLVSPALLQQALGALEGGAVGGGSRLALSGGGPVARLLVGAWNGLSSRLGLAAGSFLFCRREAWEGAGGFDERVYAGEEIWFSRRLKRWGRERGMAFRILASDPPVTSSRRMDTPGALCLALAQFLLLALCPWLSRSRRACFLWYRR